MTFLVAVLIILVTVLGVFPLSGWLIKNALYLLGFNVAVKGYIDYILIGGSLWLAYGLLTGLWYRRRKDAG